MPDLITEAGKEILALYPADQPELRPSIPQMSVILRKLVGDFTIPPDDSVEQTHRTRLKMMETTQSLLATLPTLTTAQQEAMIHGAMDWAVRDALAQERARGEYQPTAADEKEQVNLA